MEALLALRHLPNIVRLQRFLADHFHGSIHLPTYQDTTISHFLHSLGCFHVFQLRSVVGDG